MFRRPEGEFKPPVEPKAVPMPQVYKSVQDHSGWLNTAKTLPGSLDKEVIRNYDGLKKPVNTQNDIETMLDSSGMHFVLYLILQISGNVVGMECAQKLQANDLPEDCDQVLVELVRLLEWVSALIDENLPDEEDFKASRFGSKKFRVFHEALLRGCREKLQQFLLKCSEWNDENLEGFPIIMSELYSYFVNSFGNSVRIDYGSGHELNFLAFLAGLNRINCVKETLLSFKYLGTIVFQKYLLVVRNLQRIYRLEPAGSHGVWGLDDFQFISPSQLSTKIFWKLTRESIFT
ncbi:hypothetical protein MP638_002915 [Amoeboaphelidium occidentale]|nr:hypothetical protein MP638_002915 [Amoeboaphelidium occidentale]